MCEFCDFREYNAQHNVPSVRYVPAKRSRIANILPRLCLDWSNEVSNKTDMPMR